MFQTQPASSVKIDYSSNDVARISGVSLRQLQWWDEKEVVEPIHDGHKRVYLAEHVIEIMVIGQLRRKGFSLQKIRLVLRYLQREIGKRLSDAGAAELYLLFDGKSIYLETGIDRVMDVLKKSKLPMHLVSISDQMKRLTER